MKLFIIADDFTGALDTGAKFAKYDVSIRVLLTLDDGLVWDNSVLIYDAETRHMSPEEAYETVSAAVKWAERHEITHIYKKTDSALRGNVGAELKALLDATGEPVIFAPAYPKLGRTTVDGVQMIRGVPTAESEFGVDLFDPVRHSRVADIIHETADIPVSVTQARVHQEKCEAAFPTDRPGILVVNAETDEELHTAAECSKETGMRLFSGCAGFAGALAAAFFRNVGQKNLRRFSPCLLVACGSVNPASTRQMITAEKAGYPRIALSERQIKDASYPSGEEAKQKALEWAGLCEQHGMLILDVNTSKANTSNSKKERCTVARNLTELVQNVLDTGLRPTLMCTGGDIAVALIKRLQIKELVLLEELQPGIILSRIEYRNDLFFFVSKAGGFGSPDLLLWLKETIIV